jgi:DNA-binding MarR family transcriptional regulator
MRHDFTPDIPREVARPVTPLPPPEPEPGPVASRIDRLDSIAEDRRPPRIPQPERTVDPEVRRERDVEVNRGGDRHDRRDRRDNHVAVTIDVRLRPEERQLMTDVARFRVIAARDLERHIYNGNAGALDRDLHYLESKGLLTKDTVNVRRDNARDYFKDGMVRVRRIEVVTLTERGRKLIARVSDLEPGQKTYAHLVKPREVEHDTQIYGAYRKEAARIEREGGKPTRVELDFELKSKVQSAMYAEHKAQPDRDMDEIRRQVAEQHRLPMVDGHMEIPDARVHYEMPQGGGAAFSDIEVVTAAYRPGHLRGKSQAGFRMYVSGRDAGKLGALIENEHHLLDNILDL